METVTKTVKLEPQPWYEKYALKMKEAKQSPKSKLDFTELKDQIFAKKHNTTRENFNPKPSKTQQKKHLAALEQSLGDDRLLKKLALIQKHNEGVQDLVDVKPKKEKRTLP